MIHRIKIPEISDDVDVKEKADEVFEKVLKELAYKARIRTTKMLKKKFGKNFKMEKGFAREFIKGARRSKEGNRIRSRILEEIKKGTSEPIEFDWKEGF